MARDSAESFQTARDGGDSFLTARDDTADSFMTARGGPSPMNARDSFMSCDNGSDEENIDSVLGLSRKTDKSFKEK